MNENNSSTLRDQLATVIAKPVLYSLLRVWMLSCLLIIAYVLLHIAYGGMVAWLDIAIFSVWVLVAGSWLIHLPIIYQPRPWQRLLGWLGLFALSMPFVWVAWQWLFTADDLRGEFYQEIPNQINLWLQILLVVVAGLLLALTALLWHLIYRGLFPAIHSCIRWFDPKWRLLGQSRYFNDF